MFGKKFNTIIDKLRTLHTHNCKNWTGKSGFVVFLMATAAIIANIYMYMYTLVCMCV